MIVRLSSRIMYPEPFFRMTASFPLSAIALAAAHAISSVNRSLQCSIGIVLHDLEASWRCLHIQRLRRAGAIQIAFLLTWLFFPIGIAFIIYDPKATKFYAQAFIDFSVRKAAIPAAKCVPDIAHFHYIKSKNQSRRTRQISLFRPNMEQ